MTDRTLHQAKRLLRRGVTAEETAALLGLSPRQIEFVRQSIEREAADGAGGDELRLRDAYFGSIVERLADSVRELFEYGCDAEEICERLGQLVDVVGENVLKERAQRKMPVMVSAPPAAEEFFPIRHSTGIVDSPTRREAIQKSQHFFAGIFHRNP